MDNFTPRLAKIAKINTVDNGTGEDLGNATIDIVNAVIGALGLVCVVIIVIGGINYMTSSGDATKVKKAKDTILYAVIGLVVCALSFAITNFVIAKIIDNAGSTDYTSYTTQTKCEDAGGVWKGGKCTEK